MQKKPQSNSLQSSYEDRELRAIFCDYGLADAECAVISTLLRLGNKQASAIAKYSGVSRAHVYGILERLEARGFIASHEKNGIKNFSAVSVDQLLHLLSSKESALADRRKQLEQLATSFRSNERNSWSAPVSRKSKGKEVRDTLLRELSANAGEFHYLYCSLSSSVVFERPPATVAEIAKLLELGGQYLRLILFGNEDPSAELKAAFSSDRVCFVKRDVPGEFLISKNSTTIFGMNANVCQLLSIEQEGFSEIFLHLAKELYQEDRRPLDRLN